MSEPKSTPVEMSEAPDESNTPLQAGSSTTTKPFSLSETLTQIDRSEVSTLPPGAGKDPVERAREQRTEKEAAGAQRKLEESSDEEKTLLEEWQEAKARREREAEEKADETLLGEMMQAEAQLMEEDRAEVAANATTKAKDDTEMTHYTLHGPSQKAHRIPITLKSPQSPLFSSRSPVAPHTPTKDVIAALEERPVMDAKAQINSLTKEVQKTHELLRQRKAEIEERDGQIEGLYESVRQRDENAAKFSIVLQERAMENAKLRGDNTQLSALEERFGHMEDKVIHYANEVKSVRKEVTEEKRVNKQWSERNLVLENDRRNMVRQCEMLETAKTAIQGRVRGLELENIELGQEKAKYLDLLQQTLREGERKDQEISALREEQGEAMDITSPRAVSHRSVSGATHGSLQDELAEMGESLDDVQVDDDSRAAGTAAGLTAKLADADVAHAQTRADLTAAREQLAAVEAQRDAAFREVETLRDQLATAVESRDYHSQRLEQVITSAKEYAQAQQEEHLNASAKLAATHLEIQTGLESKLAAHASQVAHLEAQMATQGEAIAKEFVDLATSKDAEIAHVKSELGAAAVAAAVANAAHAGQVANLEARIASQSELHVKELADLAASKDAEIDQIKSELEVDDVHAAHARRVASLEAQIAAQGEVLATKLADLTASKNQEIAWANSVLETIDAKASRLERASDDHLAELAEVRATHQQRLGFVELQHSNEMERARESNESQLLGLRHEIGRLNAFSTISELEKQDTNEAHERALAELQAEYDSTSDACERVHAAELASMQQRAAVAPMRQEAGEEGATGTGGLLLSWGQVLVVLFGIVTMMIVNAATWGKWQQSSPSDLVLAPTPSRAPAPSPMTIPAAASPSVVCDSVSEAMGGWGWWAGASIVGRGVSIEDLVVGFYG